MYSTGTGNMTSSGIMYHGTRQGEGCCKYNYCRRELEAARNTPFAFSKMEEDVTYTRIDNFRQ
jgi:hypothetical protein